MISQTCFDDDDDDDDVSLLIMNSHSSCYWLIPNTNTTKANMQQFRPCGKKPSQLNKAMRRALLLDLNFHELLWIYFPNSLLRHGVLFSQRRKTIPLGFIPYKHTALTLYRFSVIQCICVSHISWKCRGLFDLKFDPFVMTHRQTRRTSFLHAAVQSDIKKAPDMQLRTEGEPARTKRRLIQNHRQHCRGIQMKGGLILGQFLWAQSCPEARSGQIYLIPLCINKVDLKQYFKYKLCK